MPGKDPELKAFQVAFLIPRQRAHHGVYCRAFQVFSDFRRIVRLIQACLQRLQRRVGGPHEGAARILFLRLDRIHDRFVRRHLVVVLRLGYQQAFRRLAGDVRQETFATPSGPINWVFRPAARA